jgi:hypothetical protein
MLYDFFYHLAIYRSFSLYYHLIERFTFFVMYIFYFVRLIKISKKLFSCDALSPLSIKLIFKVKILSTICLAVLNIVLPIQDFHTFIFIEYAINKAIITLILVLAMLIF